LRAIAVGLNQMEDGTKQVLWLPVYRDLK